ncbi:EcoKI restriction-modification system protein HsdS [Legionella quinlivanii]|uniref:EcoKI restriction-modification system protein HsdS n=1 Tax=Legionella quinlivanii TaxID=45073 RepID=A0A0W0Y5J0_9GAMM|nr:restriction endonuclease subunit S [Legionella quinlivanii]KTD52247.1 EcoKI restriction-modification system protein HsdS [Legionella quinlivanii]SEF74570.1 type I restriction enzyme, S subunit [Legionella quinlivanii DSM 21216]STY12254.1 EcoKI restriction-modification system protein HsdS [Legionella quinlivanii]
MMPEGWRKCHLIEILHGQIKNGYSPNAADVETGYWVLGLGVLGDSSCNFKEIKPVYPTLQVLRNLLCKDDFLISRSNTPDKVGRSMRFKGELSNCSYPDLMMRFRIDEKKADLKFIEIQLKSAPVRGYFKNCAAGSSNTMVKINKSIVEKVPLLLPPLNEQKKIAQILSTWDKAITTTEKLLANSEQQKNALMQQLLSGKERLLDKYGQKFRAAWIAIHLKDLCSIITGKKDVNEGNPDGNYPFFTCASAPTKCDGYSYDCEAILIAGNGMIGKTHYYNGKFEAYQRTYILNNFNKIICVSYLHQFILYWLICDIEREKQHGAMPYIKLGLLQQFNVFVPSIEEQQKIAMVLSTADHEIEKIKQQLEWFKQEKKALMQQLLTGRRRVTLAETNNA